MTAIEFDEDDIGKEVVHGSETVGRVVNVEHGTAYVEADPDLTDTLKTKLGWSAETAESVPIQDEAVSTVTDDEVLLSQSI